MDSEEMFEAILEEVSRHGGISRDELLRGRRCRRLRQIAVYLAHQLTRRSLPQIGQHFGMGHTNVLFSIRVVERDIAIDLNLARTVAELKRKLGG